VVDELLVQGVYVVRHRALALSRQWRRPQAPVLLLPLDSLRYGSAAILDDSMPRALIVQQSLGELRCLVVEPQDQGVAALAQTHHGIRFLQKRAQK
jgi:hypothetical protein